MTLHIPLSPESEAKLRERASQVGKDPNEYAREILEENLAGEVANRIPRGQRVAEFLNWVASHRPIGRFVDDSRETIYRDRGE